MGGGRRSMGVKRSGVFKTPGGCARAEIAKTES